MTNKERLLQELDNLPEEIFANMAEDLICSTCHICPSSLCRYCETEREEHSCLSTIADWFNLEYDEADENLIKELD